jgi:Helix-turn-helix family
MFYNFTTTRIAKALPAAWQIAGPAAALTARLDSAVAALRRSGVVDGEATRTAAELAAQAARTAPLDGRPLYAANRALDWPDEPVAKLWHAVTLLREQRGDAHVAILVGEGITGRQCNVLQAAGVARHARCSCGAVTTTMSSGRCTASSCASAGCSMPGGSSPRRAGGSSRRSRTAPMPLTALDGLTDAEVETLFRTLTPITRQVVAAGDVPAATPMGLRRDDLDDDSAQLG